MRYAPLLGMLAGCGSGDLNFNSTPDPTVNLDGESVMELSAEALDWADLEVGKSRSQTLVLTSAGDNPLQLDGAAVLGVDAGAFFIQEDVHQDVTLPTGSTHEVTIVCTLDAEAEISAYLRLDTNDSELPIRDVPLHGTPLGWTGGDTDDTDAVPDTDGGM